MSEKPISNRFWASYLCQVLTFLTRQVNLDVARRRLGTLRAAVARQQRWDHIKQIQV